MNLLAYILFFNLLGSVISLTGGFVLLGKPRLFARISHYITSFAAGALLATALFDLLPEAIEEGANVQIAMNTVFLYVLFGIIFFFLLERLLHWFHHHSMEEHEIQGKPIIPLLIIGDTIHNFIDGIAIAATFMINIPLGIITTFAVGAHEIPQEIGDFGVMLNHGVKRGKVLLINILSACASFVGALLAFYFGGQIEGLSAFFLAVSAGFFLYIALSDLIPEIHHQNKKRFALAETISLLLGVGTIYYALYFVANILHVGH